MTTRITLIDRALVMIGEDPLQSETAPGAETHIITFDAVVEDLLSRNDWHWATTTQPLPRRETPPPGRWRHAFDLPADMLGAPQAVFDAVDLQRHFTGFELHEERLLLTEAEAVWVRYTRLGSPLYWPGYFRSCVVHAMAAELALSVREEASLRRTLRHELYGDPSVPGETGMLGQAKARDSMAKPSPVLAHGSNPLLEVR